MASIARLDTLLEEGRSQAGNAKFRKIADSSDPTTGIVDGLQVGASKNARERDRKPARGGGIAKARVRNGGGKETKTCASARPAPAVLGGGLNTSPAVPAGMSPTNATAIADASTTSTCTVVFPPLSSRGLPHTSDGAERIRFPPLDGNGNGGGDEAFDRRRARAWENERSSQPAETLETLAAPALLPGLPHAEDRRQLGWRGSSATYDFRPQEEFDRPRFVQAGRTADNDRYRTCERAPPRYPSPREENWIEPRGFASTRYQDVGHEGHHRRSTSHYDNGYDMRGGGGGGDVYHHQRVAVDPEHLWEMRTERRDWERQPREDEQPMSCRDRDDRRAWDRCHIL